MSHGPRCIECGGEDHTPFDSRCTASRPKLPDPMGDAWAIEVLTYHENEPTAWTALHEYLKDKRAIAGQVVIPASKQGNYSTQVFYKVTDAAAIDPKLLPQGHRLVALSKWHRALLTRR